MSRRPSTPSRPRRLRRIPVGSALGLLAAVQSLGNLAASAIAALLLTLVSPTAALIHAADWMVPTPGLAGLRPSR